MRTVLQLQRLEGRDSPAVLDIVGGNLTFTDGGAEDNSLTVSVGTGPSAAYTFADAATVISLGSGAVAAGWRGGGTGIVSGPAPSVDRITISAGGGTNTVNLRSIAAGTTVNGDSGTTAINISSTAPTNNGNLAGIKSAVTVNAGDATSLWVSDLTGTARPSTVVIGAGGITGLATNAINYSGTFASLRVSGSTSASLAETYTVTSPPAAYFRLDCNGGPDAVTISGDTTGDIYLGGGDDALTVLDGVTFTGNVHTGGQAGDVVNANADGFGAVTGSVGA